MALRFHLDEHVDPAIAEALRRRGIDVTTTIEASLRTASDAAHIEFARRERRVIYTQDADYLVLAAAGAEHAGITYSAPDTRTIRQIVEFLLLLDACMDTEEMRNQVEYVLP